MTNVKRKSKLSIWQILTLGFLVVVAVGSLLLTLPFSTKGGQKTSYINALFTATSATCVTGLTPYDVNLHWSVFGQVVIFLLIQLGGLGFMTFVSILFELVGRGLGLTERRVVMLASGETRFSDLRKLVKRILLGTLIFEGAGALLLSIRFISDFGIGRGIYYAIFHAVSAFCNAGFDLMGGTFGGGAFVSLTHYATDPLVSLTICGLIVVGGLGFCVWSDVLDARGNPRKFSLHTKIVLIGSAVLLSLSTALFLLFERNSVAVASCNAGEKLLVAFFNAVTPRTAGFSCIDPNTLSDSGYLLTIVLMAIGGNPASTAGGIKLTTLVVIVVGMLSVFRGKKDIELGKKRIASSLLSEALAIFVSFLFVTLLATGAICAIEPNAGFKAVLFEVVSALGTVGSSLSLTPMLSIASKIILILLMFTGRVGILTIALAVARKQTNADVRKPLDNLLIG